MDKLKRIFRRFAAFPPAKKQKALAFLASLINSIDDAEIKDFFNLIQSAFESVETEANKDEK